MDSMIHRLAWCLSLVFLGAGCSEGAVLIGEIRPRGEPTPPPAPAPPAPNLDAGAPDTRGWPPPIDCTSTEDIMAHFLVPRCSLCHNGKPDGAPPALAFGDPRQGIIGHKSACPGKSLITVVDGYVVGGHFFDKLAGPVPGCGDQMPYGGVIPLNDVQSECMRTWFQAGLNNP
jgi:hypothetical protein